MTATLWAMRTGWAGILIVLAALVAVPSAWAQEPTSTPTPTASPTPEPTPTPEEIEEAERKEKLRKRKIVRRVYQDYQRDARIDNCDHSRTALKRTLESITDEFDTDFPDFREAVKAAIKDHDKERCEEAEPTPTATPTPSPSPTPAPTTTPAPSTLPPSTDSGDLPDLGTGGGGGGGRDGGGSTPPPAETAPPAPEGDVTPVQPEATPAPTAVPPPAEPQLAVVRPDGDRSLLLAAILLAAALAGLALLAASALAARRSERLAGWAHAWREAAYRATGAWGDFGDWLRLGR
jgi:hypothetical protein